MPQERFLAQSETQVRVRYAETDQMGVVYHANYLVWFEIGRTTFLRELGFNYKQMEQEDGCLIAVAAASARYRLPARYDDVLSIRTQMTAMRGPVIKFAYQVVRLADEQLLAEGETTHVVVSSDMKKMTLPEKYAVSFRELVGKAEVDLRNV